MNNPHGILKEETASHMMSKNGFERPVRVTDGIYWIGTFDPDTELHCNPYLVEGEKGVAVIDSGSRPDFAGVMMKILQAGIHPGEITALIYQHFDPDLCGSLPNFLDLCANPDLRVYSKPGNNVFIKHYVEKAFHSRFVDVQEGETFSLGDRQLKFIGTPYAHAAESFITFDERTRTLFTSDIFGSFRREWEMFLDLDEKCFDCSDYAHCQNGKPESDCPFPSIITFHKSVMPSTRALRFAMNRILKMDSAIIAPQHGSILRSSRVISHVIHMLQSLEAVGIDGVSET